MDIHQLLGKEADSLLGHTCNGIPKDFLMLPGPDYVDRVMVQSDRSIAVLRNLAQVYDHGRLGGTGYLSILPVDQGVEHSGAASFARNPALLRSLPSCSSSWQGQSKLTPDSLLSTRRSTPCPFRRPSWPAAAALPVRLA